MNDLQKIARQLTEKNDFILVSHAIPDGDCIGSLLGLYIGLQSLGKNPYMILQDAVPDIYRYLNCAGEVHSSVPPGAAEAVVFLDCSDQYRVGEQVLNMLPRDTLTINIDHHQTNQYFADYNLVCPQAAATAEIIYDLLQQMQVQITAPIAEALYAGILMDTGGFLYSNTSSHTFRIAAQLLEKGVDISRARINLFESKSREEVLLLRQALRHIGFNHNGKVAWMVLPYDEVNEIGAAELHPEGIINYTRMIKGVEVGILFRETIPGEVKIGFRSKGSIDVSLLAKELGGGGHQQAAGARQLGPLEQVKNRVISMVENVVN